MALAEAGNDGALNGVTAVDVVPAPASGHTFISRSIVICNKDTAAVTVTLNLINGANTRRLIKQTLDIDATLVFETIVNLDATTKKIQAVLSGAPATTNPDFVAAYADRS
jgi:hypothetical protein